MSELKVRPTSIQGLFEVTLKIDVDERGSFREAFQAEKLQALGLPEFKPVQWNIATNKKKGTLRGIHAEPWDKYVHMVSGRAFAAIADLRKDSPTYAAVETFTLTNNNALFISRGLGNSYQTLTANAIYGYVVNEHWSPDAKYTLISYRDPTLAIKWPYSPATVSAKDEGHPPLAD